VEEKMAETAVKKVKKEKNFPAAHAGAGAESQGQKF
jgi:hypothetical protein